MTAKSPAHREREQRERIRIEEPGKLQRQAEAVGEFLGKVA